jgi:anhydro-N-acetylmuramic acid kinase
VDELCRLNVLLGELFAEAAAKVADAAGLDLEDVDLIGSHGQTVRHLPKPETRLGHTTRCTLQIGEPCVIAERTGITTVADFRPRDMAAGGEGAPLVPLVDYLLFRSSNLNRAILNIGGIANITFLPAGCALGDVLAMDVGPGNMVIDHLAGLLTSGRERCDRGGQMASRGMVHEPLLAELMEHPFLQRPPPKSAGREDFGAGFSEDLYVRALQRKLRAEDVIATATAFTAHAVHDAVKRFAPCHVDEFVVSGGGVHNATLMRHLERLFDPIRVLALEALGMCSDAKEAVAFAVLANETLSGNPGNLPKVTGASRPAVLGKIVPGRPLG